MPNINELKRLVESLSQSEKYQLQAMLASSGEEQESVKSLEDSRFSNGIFCPKCGCLENIVKFGRYKDLQRYGCKDCSSTFTAKSDSIFYKSTKSLETWKKYVDCLLQGLSIRKSARVCGLSIPTSFLWRHKILEAIGKALDKKQPKLKGIIESDETFFRVSYKGARELPEGRLAHRRGEKAGKRGLSKEQVCVACGLDRQGAVLSKISNLGKVSSADLVRVYSGKVEKDSIFCTDSEKAYKRFAAQKGYRLIQLESGKHRLCVYHINNVNAFHNNLKRFMDKFRGVSTKHLDNYLIWNLAASMSSNTAIATIGENSTYISCKAILQKSEIPVS